MSGLIKGTARQLVTRAGRRRAVRQFSAPVEHNFDKLGVIGLGLMGHGIAQTAAAAAAKDGIHSSIIAYETDQDFLDRGRDRIQKSVDRLVSRDKMESAMAEALMEKITFTTDRSALADTDLIVEAIIENMDLKKKLYSELGAECKPETVFASNTSSLSITEMALASSRPDKFVGVVGGCSSVEFCRLFANSSGPALLQPSPGNETRRGDQDGAHKRGRVRADAGLGKKDRQGRGKMRRYPWVHRKPPPRSEPYPGDTDAGEERCRDEGHRSQYAARGWPADGESLELLAINRVVRTHFDLKI